VNSARRLATVKPRTLVSLVLAWAGLERESLRVTVIHVGAYSPSTGDCMSSAGGCEPCLSCGVASA